MTSPDPASTQEPTAPGRRRSGPRVARVRGRLSLPTLRRSTSLLDGRHRSVFVGHGQDFDDLSVYRPGDDVTDIDWKASARTGQPVIKRYQRESNLPLVLAVDTSRTMAAQAPSGEDKRDLALAVAEVFAYLARLRGDTVALVAADAARVITRPARSGGEHAEMILSLLEHQFESLTHGNALAPDAPGAALSTLLERVGTWHRRRSLVVLITDTFHPDAETDPAVVDRLRRLSAQHELIAVQIADDTPLAPGRGRTRDVELDGEIPAFLREDAALAAKLSAAADARRAAVTALLDARRIEHTAIRSDASMVDSIAALLARQRLASSRSRRGRR
ncbi:MULTISPECIES: DUF58 domain-containing protein [unclassified Actinomyces]|uniref:DUF58 domain-containing protein n=1 Tax=unclassified Actinomyces TaxID=2609248 RepID=UPI001373E7EB|nr:MULTISPECIES: DUF58 domain-containing protein [unclassified Actinomyces]NDR53362.1 DUF58 domain-containing protein [Actinomyces sp. 565]QHO91875.1 DUF58 domain-containing protein [Actinomyces sp. 432]